MKRDWKITSLARKLCMLRAISSVLSPLSPWSVSTVGIWSAMVDTPSRRKRSTSIREACAASSSSGWSMSLARSTKFSASLRKAFSWFSTSTSLPAAPVFESRSNRASPCEFDSSTRAPTSPA